MRSELGGQTYGIVDDILGSRVVVDVYGDAPESTDFAGQLVQARVVLALALVGV